MSQKFMITLLMEDEPLIAKAIEDEHGAPGFSVLTVMGCSQAIAWLDAHTPDVVSADIQLMSGSSHDVVWRPFAANSAFVVHFGDQPLRHHSTPLSKGQWVSMPSAAAELTDVARFVVKHAVMPEDPGQFPENFGWFKLRP